MSDDGLPPYSMRVSKKARYLQLRIRANVLEIVIPARTKLSQVHITQFLIEQRAWIAKRLAAYKQDSLQVREGAPRSFVLTALNESWQVIYRPTMSKRTSINIKAGGELLIQGAIENHQQCILLLKKWLKLKARCFLESRLMQLADKTQLSFANFSVRDMMSRWGSCSSQKKINLCTNLVFLPAYLVDHVILHELCHTKYMNHGKRFSTLLERCDTNARDHARELRYATQFIPSWAFKS